MGVWPRNILVGPLFESVLDLAPFSKFLEAALTALYYSIVKVVCDYIDIFRTLYFIQSQCYFESITCL